MLLEQIIELQLRGPGLSGQTCTSEQRWSPRGHILKSLASRPQVLENWPVLSSRTALFLGMLKFCGALEKLFGKRFLMEIAWRLEIARKIFVKTFIFFFGEHLRLCPWSLALASSIPVLGHESVCSRKGCPRPWPRIFFMSLALASSLESSTPPLLTTLRLSTSGLPIKIITLEAPISETAGSRRMESTPI